MVWFERQSPRSKYGNVRLELFTTPNRLTASGQEAMQAIGMTGRAEVSAHAISCKRVPLNRIEDLAKAMFRASTRAGNYELEKHPACEFAASA